MTATEASARRIKKRVVDLFTGPLAIALSNAVFQGGTIATIFLVQLLFAVPWPDIFALFLSFQLVLAAYATSRFELAIPYRGMRFAREIVALALLSLGVFTALTVVVVTFLNRGFEQPLLPWLDPSYVVMAILMPLYNVARGILISGKRYFTILAMAVAAFLLPAAALTMGWAAGIVDAVPLYAAGLAFAVLPVIVGFLWPTARARIRFGRLAPLARRLADYPKNVLATGLLNSMVSVGLPILLSIVMGVREAALVFILQRFLSIPTSMYTTPLWQHFHYQIQHDPDRPVDRELYGHAGKLTYFWAALLVLLIAARLVGQAYQIEALDLYFLIGFPILLVSIFRSISNLTSYFAAFGKQGLESAVNIALGSLTFLTIFVGARLFDDSHMLMIYGFVLGSAYSAIAVYWASHFSVLRTIAMRLLLLWGLSLALFASIVAG